jgi:GNAT superfamily N-acetyltransferase
MHWDAWSAAGNSALVLARNDDALAAVVTLHCMTVLHRPRPVGRITALVVEETMRGQGIGRALVNAAEVAPTSAGCGLLEITSNARLVDAHAFYERLGYERTSVRLAKTLV